MLLYHAIVSKCENVVDATSSYPIHIDCCFNVANYLELTFFSSGEGVVDDSVWMVKTHYPERMGYLKFKARRIVLLVRNPFDAIESYFHMGMTNTHDKHLSPKVIIAKQLK